MTPAWHTRRLLPKFCGGKDLIRNWQLLTHATERLQRDGVEGLKRYYDEYVDLPKGRWVNEILEGHRRKTLKSERRLFMIIYNSTSHIVDAGTIGRSPGGAIRN